MAVKSNSAEDDGGSLMAMIAIDLPLSAGKRCRRCKESAVRSDEGTPPDLTTYYSAYCRSGMVDLSRSNGEPAPLAPAFESVPWAAVRPPGGVVPLRAAIAAHCYRRLGP